MNSYYGYFPSDPSRLRNIDRRARILTALNRRTQEKIAALREARARATPAIEALRRTLDERAG